MRLQDPEFQNVAHFRNPKGQVYKMYTKSQNLLRHYPTFKPFFNLLPLYKTETAVTFLHSVARTQGRWQAKRNKILYKIGPVKLFDANRLKPKSVD